jgi:geranylgeranyl reductase family protein
LRRGHDVIVVGGGPAGSTAAYELGRRGVDVLLIDKAIFPRRKCCGGGITLKTARILGADLLAITQNSISSATLSFSGSNQFHGKQDSPVMYTVDRKDLDQFLLDRAQKAGAEVIQGVSVAGISVKANNAEVVTSAGSFGTQFVVGADGSRSIVARSANLGRHEQVAGIETEVVVGEEDLETWRSSVLIELGRIRRGYAWLFPKKDHLSIGIASPIGEARDLKRHYWQFLDSLGLSRRAVATWSAGLIPMYVGKPRVTHGRVALVGDAAGLADPLTGEGIYNAAFSAQLAAPVIQGALLEGKSNLHDYQVSLEEKIGAETSAARSLSRIIGAIPRRLLTAMDRDSRIWNAGCSLLRGDTTYRAIKDRVATLGGIYTVLRGR